MAAVHLVNAMKTLKFPTTKSSMSSRRPSIFKKDGLRKGRNLSVQAVKSVVVSHLSHHMAPPPGTILPGDYDIGYIH
jgi:hypothetical protein